MLVLLVSRHLRTLLCFPATDVAGEPDHQMLASDVCVSVAFMSERLGTVRA